MGERRAGAVGGTAPTRRAAVTLVPGSVSSVVMSSGIRAVGTIWHPQPYPSTSLQSLTEGSTLVDANNRYFRVHAGPEQFDFSFMKVVHLETNKSKLVYLDEFSSFKRVSEPPSSEEKR